MFAARVACARTASRFLVRSSAASGKIVAPRPFGMRGFGAAAATPQPIVLSRDMDPIQWYIHFRREDGHDMAAIKKSVQGFRQDCAQRGVKLLVAFGPDMLQKVTTDCPSPFANYETFKSIDGSGKEAKGTQEDMLVWLYSPKKDDLWKASFDLREGLKGNMKVARETQTFIYGDSLDMTGFADGTGNPEAHRDQEVACIADGQPGAGGAFLIAQRWVHDLSAFNKLSVPDQEKVFGRTKDGSVKLADVPNNAHLAKMDYREGANADDSKAKRDEITRRSTPYSHPAPPTGGDGVNGLYFIGFCRSQQPLIDRMNGMYGLDGSVRDRLTDFSNPASGSFYFAPSVQALDAM